MVRPWVKIAGIAIVVAAIGFGLVKLSGGKMTLLPNNGSNSGEISSNSLKNLFGGKNDKDVITIGVNTYCGFAPIVKMNNGLDPNENCDFYKKYGLKVKVVIQDDFNAGRSAFKSDEINVIYCTTDVRSIELGANSSMLGTEQFMVLNFSRGSDALVVNKNIQTVQDMVGKTFAYAEGTASNTLFLNVLETSGIDPAKVKTVKVESGLEAADFFKAGKVDGAVVWAPDDADLVASIKGAKVLFSTKQATNIITDGLIAKDTYIENNPDKIKKLVEAILWGNSEMNNNSQFVQDAAQIFAKAFKTDADFVLNTASNIRFATLGDEENLFGFNTDFNGVTADQMYTRMSRVYQDLGLTNKPLPWRKASNSSIIEALIAKNSLNNDQSPETVKTFAAPTAEDTKKQEISDKEVIINFATNSSNLDNDARNIIDGEFAPIAQQFANTRVKVEGNTDNTGNADTNRELSKRRAQAVVDYLVKEYSMDRNRFIVIGNGSKNAIAAGSVGSDQRYRTTNFKLLSE